MRPNKDDNDGNNDENPVGSEEVLVNGGEEAPEDSSDEEESSDDDDDLGLEGTLMRNPDVPEEDWSEEEEEEHEEDGDDEKTDSKEGTSKKRPREEKHTVASSKAVKKEQRTRQKPRDQGPDSTDVEFSFVDMNERFFHGVKSLLHGSSTVYQKDSSALSDLMIDNDAVGTVVTDGNGGTGEEPYVFGFGSVLNLTEHKDAPVINEFKEFCLAQCPAEHKKELQVVLSGKTKRPAGFYFHSRMINMPMEIVQVLHQQLVLDMDWAVEHAEGGPEARRECDYGAFVRLAPCQREGSDIVYRYFDDEVFCGRAEFHFTMDAPISYSKEEKQLLNIMVLTKTGHRDAMIDLDRMINGTKS